MSKRIVVISPLLYNVFMSYRSIKKLIYGIFYLLILTIFIGVIYLLLFHQSATCFDNKKNQGETEIDCGGPCVSCEIKNAKPLEVVWTKALRITSDKASVVAKIRNPNLNIGASNFDYKFDIYGPFGVKLRTLAGNSFIYPGETKYIMEAGIVLPSADEISSVDFKDSNWQWISKDQFIKPNIVARDLKPAFPSTKENFLEIEGIARNISSYNLGKVVANVIIYKKDGTPVAASKTEIKNLISLRELPFKFIFPESFTESSTLDLEKIETTFEAKI